MVSLVEQEFKKHENTDFEYLFLSEMNLEFCRGCGVCIEKKQCIIDDNLNNIIKIIDNNDLLLFASPVYVYRETALVKNFIDRFHYNHFQPKYFDKFAVSLSVGAILGVNETSDYLDFNLRGWGFKVVDKLKVQVIEFYKNTEYKNKIKKQISKLLTKIKKNKLKITKKDLEIFKEHKYLINAYKNKYPETYKYWQENNWLDKNYYFDLPD